jgi:hypothetical protein
VKRHEGIFVQKIMIFLSFQKHRFPPSRDAVSNRFI